MRIQRETPGLNNRPYEPGVLQCVVLPTFHMCTNLCQCGTGGPFAFSPLRFDFPCYSQLDLAVRINHTLDQHVAPGCQTPTSPKLVVKGVKKNRWGNLKELTFEGCLVTLILVKKTVAMRMDCEMGQHIPKRKINEIIKLHFVANARTIYLQLPITGGGADCFCFLYSTWCIFHTKKKHKHAWGLAVSNKSALFRQPGELIYFTKNLGKFENCYITMPRNYLGIMRVKKN